MDIDLVAGITAVPLIIALIEVAKRTWPAWDRDRYGTLTAVLIGVILALAYQAPGAPGDAIAAALRDAVVTGVGLGLSASGLFSGAKSAIKAGGRP